MMVEIFVTSVSNKALADSILKTLRVHLPAYFFNFDLDDCDRVLRVQSPDDIIETAGVIRIVKDHCVEISLFKD